MYQESNLRSFTKAASNRFTNSLATVALVYLFTDQLEAALQVGLTEIVVKFALFYAHERVWNNINFGKKQREPFILWFTGLPFSGKKVLADIIYERLKKKGIKIQRLDGDDVKTLFPLGGFTRKERDAYLKRMGYFASILEKNGVTVIASFISPFIESRKYNRDISQNYIEVYVSTPIEECKKNDEWGLYKKAERNEIRNFIGVHEKYEVPVKPEVTVDLSKNPPSEAVKSIMKHLYKKLI